MMIVIGSDQECVSALEKPYTSANKPSDAVAVPDRSSAGGLALRALVDKQPQCRERRGECDREVHEQGQPPREQLGQHPANEKASRRARPGDRAEHAKRLTTLVQV